MGSKTLISMVWLGATALLAQDPVSPTDSYTPAAMAAGTPQGTTSLSPHEAVNLYNGTLTFVVPIHQVTGRGGAGYSMVLPIGMKWNIENHPDGNGFDHFTPFANIYPYETLWPRNTSPHMYSPGRILRREVVDPSQSTFHCTSNGYT